MAGAAPGQLHRRGFARRNLTNWGASSRKEIRDTFHKFHLRWRWRMGRTGGCGVGLAFHRDWLRKRGSEFAAGGRRDRDAALSSGQSFF